ncbi:MAG: NAD(P)-dependent oxidoreductase [Gemmatimonadaceae bacterium]
MRALVTGATGLVGSYIAERLHEDGWNVRALVRDRKSSAWLVRDVGVDLYPGDITDVDSLAAAARGCDAVFHAAATITSAGGWASYRAVNVEGTRHVVQAAAAVDAQLIHISSVAVYGPSTRYRADGLATDEDTPSEPLPPSAHYARSKREAEDLVLTAHATGRPWAIALRPDVVYGRRDRQFVPRVARTVRFGVAPLFGAGDSLLPTVHAANVADAAVRAASRPEAGGRAFNITNDFDLSYRDLIAFAAEGLNRRIRLVPLPIGVARCCLSAAQTVASLVTGQPGGITTRAAIDFLTRGNPFTSARARCELGWMPQVRPATSVPDAFRSLVEHTR